MKKVLIIALLALGITSIETKGSVGGAFAGSFIGSSMGTTISNNNRDGGDCSGYENQIKKYEYKNKALRKKNDLLERAVSKDRGMFEEFEDDFQELIDDFDEDL